MLQIEEINNLSLKRTESKNVVKIEDKKRNSTNEIISSN
jgi:hypothetical protein